MMILLVYSSILLLFAHCQRIVLLGAFYRIMLLSYIYNLENFLSYTQGRGVCNRNLFALVAKPRDIAISRDWALAEYSS